jgi:hypothetical protein
MLQLGAPPAGHVHMVCYMFIVVAAFNVILFCTGHDRLDLHMLVQTFEGMTRVEHVCLRRDQGPVCSRRDQGLEWIRKINTLQFEDRPEGIKIRMTKRYSNTYALVFDMLNAT